MEAGPGLTLPGRVDRWKKRIRLTECSNGWIEPACRIRLACRIELASRITIVYNRTKRAKKAKKAARW